jgi:hypothetical protein
MADLLSTIRKRGYWQVTIRPSTFLAKRIANISALEGLLERCVVQIRGWDFPHIDPHARVNMDLDHIWQEFDWEDKKGIWRLHQSGQFVYVFSISEDWRDVSHWWPAGKDWKPLEQLGVGDTVYTFAEIFEFASRLALTEAGDETMLVEAAARNMSGRKLYVDSAKRWPFLTTYRTTIKDYPLTERRARADLIANHRPIALNAACEFFKRFGWDVTPDILATWLERPG